MKCGFIAQLSCLTEREPPIRGHGHKIPPWYVVELFDLSKVIVIPNLLLDNEES